MPVGRSPETRASGEPVPAAWSYPQHRFTGLLFLLLGMLVLAPVVHDVLGLVFFEDLFMTGVFIFAAYSFSRNPALLAALVTLALPALVSTWASDLMKAPGWLTILGGVCDAGFSAALTVAVLLYVFRERNVSADMIAGAIVAYLLMAVMWSQLYFVLESLRPGSFSLPAGVNRATLAAFRYFSIVTITTVGYGDIVPVSAAARAFANLEALVGQLYLVIQVSWLVGMHVSRRSK
jgi:hypothetical protein